MIYGGDSVHCLQNTSMPPNTAPLHAIPCGHDVCDVHPIPPFGEQQRMPHTVKQHIRIRSSAISRPFPSVFSTSRGSASPPRTGIQLLLFSWAALTHNCCSPLQESRKLMGKANSLPGIRRHSHADYQSWPPR